METGQMALPFGPGGYQKLEMFEEELFHVLSIDEKVPVSKFIGHLHSVGLLSDDPRLKDTMEKLTALQLAENDVTAVSGIQMDKATFSHCIKEDISMIQKAFATDLVIPEFRNFTKQITEIYHECKLNEKGEVASYIPQLARYNPEYWGVSVCTVDGQRYSIGDVDVPFPMQSTSKPLVYALAVNEHSEDIVHQHVGLEPSGETFNHIKLGKGNKPHNPLVNAGALVVGSMIKRSYSLADRFEYVSQMFQKVAGGERIGFNNAVYLSERETADRNFALAYYLKENKCFPEGSNMQEILDFYFQMCSIDITCRGGAVMAATLANGGICPTTGESVLDVVSVRNTLSLMHSCGMYDYSGEFAFKVGLPAKSGVSGCVLLVVPNVAGFCLWSPPIDRYGNSSRAIEFCQRVVRSFNFHHYDILKHNPCKLDPRIRQRDAVSSRIVELLFAAYNGDLTAIRRMALSGEDMSAADYDGRTALHLAVSEGHFTCVRFLVEKCHVPMDATDRWGHTPSDDAKLFSRQTVMTYLERYSQPEGVTAGP